MQVVMETIGAIALIWVLFVGIRGIYRWYQEIREYEAARKAELSKLNASVKEEESDGK